MATEEGRDRADQPARAGGGVPALLDRSRKRGVNVRPSRLGLRVPSLKILHKVDTAERIQAGEVPGYYKYGDRIMPAVSVVFLKVDEVRRYDIKPEGGGMPRTLCASGDGIRPFEQIQDPPSLTCEGCRYGGWKDGPEGERIPPECQPGLAFLGVIPEMNTAPFWLVCQKTAEPGAREFLRSFYHDPDAIYLHELRVRLTTEHQTSEKGGLSWYIPVFTIEKGRNMAEDYVRAFEMVQEGMVFMPFLGGGARMSEEPPERADVPPPDDSDIPF